MPKPAFPGAMINRTPVLSGTAQDAVDRVIEMEPEWTRLRSLAKPGGSVGPPAEIRRFQDLQKRINDDSLIGIAFGAMTLESCIHSLIVLLKSDQASAILNGLRGPAVTRWRLLLWRLTNELLDETHALSIAMKRTVSARNRVIRSRPIIVSQETIDELNRFDSIAEAKHAISTLRLFHDYLLLDHHLNVVQQVLGLRPPRP